MKKFAAITLAIAAAAAVAYAISPSSPTSAKISSGLEKGERVVPFHPDHVVGPLANTNNCFPCTFQARPQVQIWVNGESASNLKNFAVTLDAAMSTHKESEFKAMIVMIAPQSDFKELKSTILSLAKSNKLAHVDISMIDPKNESIGHYKVNTDSEVKNTVFVYKDWKVQEKFVNLSGDKKGLEALTAAIASIVK